MIWLLLSILVFLLGISVVRGAPYVPTHAHQVELALDLLDLKPGEALVDVGSGDGRVLIAAAKRGLYATGYEINPLLCAISWLRSRRYGSKVRVVWSDVWGRRFPENTKGVFVFTMGRYMPKLEAKLRVEQFRGVRLVSYGFELPNHRPLKKQGAVILYKL